MTRAYKCRCVEGAPRESSRYFYHGIRITGCLQKTAVLAVRSDSPLASQANIAGSPQRTREHIVQEGEVYRNVDHDALKKVATGH